MLSCEEVSACVEVSNFSATGVINGIPFRESVRKCNLLRNTVKFEVCRHVLSRMLSMSFFDSMTRDPSVGVFVPHSPCHIQVDSNPASDVELLRGLAENIRTYAGKTSIFLVKVKSEILQALR